jgi:hypothetical protein
MHAEILAIHGERDIGAGEPAAAHQRAHRGRPDSDDGGVVLRLWFQPEDLAGIGREGDKGVGEAPQFAPVLDLPYMG